MFGQVTASDQCCAARRSSTETDINNVDISMYTTDNVQCGVLDGQLCLHY